mmetsp:Transcript_4028/g.4653  ORF Transcript_4028/g.4653 Transcript_4028/m.4653 type:complete len:500 (+) Transcript_4028:83-1582(+)
MMRKRHSISESILFFFTFLLQRWIFLPFTVQYQLNVSIAPFASFDCCNEINNSKGLNNKYDGGATILTAITKIQKFTSFTHAMVLPPSIQRYNYHRQNRRLTTFHKQMKAASLRIFQNGLIAMSPSSVDFQLIKNTKSLENTMITASEIKKQEWWNRRRKVNDPLGPSKLVNELRVKNDYSFWNNNENSLNYQRIPFTKGTSSTILDFTVERVSSTPDIFLFRNLLSPEECDAVINYSRQDDSSSASKNRDSMKMNYADVTEGKSSDFRTNCKVGWIHHQSTSNSLATTNSNSIIIRNLAKELGRITGNILLTDEVKRSPRAGCEPMQLCHYYEEGGKFVLHHDGVDRVLTIIYYLNGVAGTWFPFANNNDNSSGYNNSNDNNKIFEAAIDPSTDITKLAEGLQPGIDGLVIVGQNSPLLSTNWQQQRTNKNHVVVDIGDCVAFFNYKTIPDVGGIRAERDWASLHAGLPTTKEEGEKWICNHWVKTPSLFQCDEKGQD